MYSIHRGQVETVKLLLDRGANVDARNGVIIYLRQTYLSYMLSSLLSSPEYRCSGWLEPSLDSSSLRSGGDLEDAPSQRS